MQAGQMKEEFQSHGQHCFEKHGSLNQLLNCCPLPSHVCSPAHHRSSSDTALGLVISLQSTAKPLQEPVDVPVRTYSYKKEFVLLEDLQQPSSAPPPPPFFFFPLSVFNAKVVFKTKGLVDDLISSGLSKN